MDKKCGNCPINIIRDKYEYETHFAVEGHNLLVAFPIKEEADNERL